MKVISLKENLEGHFYSHWTNVNGLIGILKSNKLLGSPEFANHMKNKMIVSTSREGNGKINYVPNWVKNDKRFEYVRIVLDMEKVSYNNKTDSFEYANSRNNPKTARSEQESEFETSIILGDVVKEINLEDSDLDLDGIKLIVNFKTKKFLKAIDSNNKPYNKIKISKDGETFNYDGNDYKLVTSLNIVRISNTKKKTVIFADDIRDLEVHKPEQYAIKNVKSKIVRIDIADVLLDKRALDNYYTIDKFDNETVTDFTIRDYLEYELKIGTTEGLNMVDRRVNHSYHTVESFIRFIKSEIEKASDKDHKIELGTYKTPKEWYSKSKK